MLKSIQKTIENKRLKRFVANRKREKVFLNLENVKTIGILFEYSEDMYPIASSLIKYFQSKKITTKALAFRNIKEKEIGSTMQTSFEIKVFTKSDLNWYKKPTGEEVEKFIDGQFDLFVDLSRSKDFIYKYISTMSLAKCKIGGLQYYCDPYDIILLEKENNNENFIKLIVDFLSSIK